MVAERTTAEQGFYKRCFRYASDIANTIGVQPTMPRIASRQEHRANAEANDPEAYYRRNMCLPFLDHLIEGIDSRFDKYGKVYKYTNNYIFFNLFVFNI